MRRRISEKNKMRQFWLGIFVLIVFLLLWVHQTVESTQLSYQIQRLEKEIKEEQNRQTELEMKRGQYLSLDFVESVAMKSLGLIVPKKENIIMLTLPKS